MTRTNRFLVLFSATTLLVALNSCSEKSGSSTPFILSGTITYDWVPAKDDVTEGGVKLDYTATAARPARRVLVEAVENNVAVASGYTDDLGAYTITVPGGKTINLRASARSYASNNAIDSTPPNNCVGSSWDVRVVNNVTGNSASNTDPTLRPTYSVSDGTSHNNAATVNMNMATTHGTSYTSRNGAPFALLDTVISVLEKVCEGRAANTFPTLYVNWSADNIGTSGNKSSGEITTSHFTTESGVGNLYILGKEDLDTDEYDDHVIAHETGHYIENKLFRADSIGGSHTQGDVLDPRVAFGEGYGNSLSGMVFNDPVYVDTSGAAQGSGFSINVSTAPVGNDRGVYSETSAQYVLWKLYENRDPTPNSGNFDHIFTILDGFQKTTPALTTLHSFSAYYNAFYGGAAEGLSSLWTDINSSYDSLCVGVCAGTGDTADVFDTDNDLGGNYFTGARKYKQGTGATFPALFWKLYKNLASGASTPDAHDQTNKGGYAAGFESNKFGMSRYYKYTGTGVTTTIAVTAIAPSACTSDVLDLYVAKAGNIVAYDEDTTGAHAGCPTATFTAVNGATYIVILQGYTTGQTSITLTVTP